MFTLGATAFGGDNDKKMVVPTIPPPESWQFKLSMPGWIPWMQGDVGLRGVNSFINLGPNDIIPKLDMVTDLRAEARKGRFSVFGEYLYMSLSDGIGTDTVVKKLDYRFDQTMAELSVAWRLIESPHGYLDVFGGVRYMNIYQRLTVQTNDAQINNLSEQLVNAASDQVKARLREALSVLNESSGTLPDAPIGSEKNGQIIDQIQKIIAVQQPLLNAAIKAHAQAKIAAIKAQLESRIARELHSKLDTTVSRTDDWWDPYIGLRGRYNLGTAWYLTASGDIGGFSVGSRLSWEAETALGCQLSRNVYAELAFRALGENYESNGLLMDTITYGPQVSLGVNF